MGGLLRPITHATGGVTAPRSIERKDVFPCNQKSQRLLIGRYGRFVVKDIRSSFDFSFSSGSYRVGETQCH